MHRPGFHCFVLLLALAGPTASWARPAFEPSSAALGTRLWVDRPVARIEVSGLRRTRPSVVLRELSSRAGSPVDWEQVENDRLRLLDLDLFADVRTEAVRDSSTDRPVLAFRLEERPTVALYPVLDLPGGERATYGLRFSTNNLYGMNYEANARGLLGGRPGMGFRLGTRWLAGYPLGAGLEAYRTHGRNHPERMDEDKLGTILSLSPRSSREQGFPLALGVEEVRFLPDAAPAAPFPVRAYEAHRWVEAGAYRDTRDYRVQARRGSRVGIFVAQNNGPLGGGSSFQRYRAHVLRVFPAGRTSALTAATQIAWSRGGVPRYQRLSLGGASTLRGTGEGALSGDSQWIAWVEHRVPLLPRRVLSILGGRYSVDLSVDGLGFADLGSIWDGRALEQGRARARWGTGVGLRFLAPLLNVWSLEVATDGHGIRLHGQGGMRL